MLRCRSGIALDAMVVGIEGDSAQVEVAQGGRLACVKNEAIRRRAPVVSRLFSFDNHSANRQEFTMIRWFLYACTILLMMNGTAHAYIDPGSAGIALQALIGAIAAAGLFIGIRMSRFLSLMRRLFRSRPAPSRQSKQSIEPRSPQ